jgi:hypothetical protein
MQRSRISCHPMFGTTQRPRCDHDGAFQIGSTQESGWSVVELRFGLYRSGSETLLRPRSRVDRCTDCVGMIGPSRDKRRTTPQKTSTLDLGNTSEKRMATSSAMIQRFSAYRDCSCHSPFGDDLIWCAGAVGSASSEDVRKKVVFIKHFERNGRRPCLRVQCPSARGR